MKVIFKSVCAILLQRTVTFIIKGLHFKVNPILNWCYIEKLHYYTLAYLCIFRVKSTIEITFMITYVSEEVCQVDEKFISQPSSGSFNFVLCTYIRKNTTELVLSRAWSSEAKFLRWCLRIYLRPFNNEWIYPHVQVLNYRC